STACSVPRPALEGAHANSSQRQDAAPMSLAPAPPAARRGLLVDLPELRDRSRAFEDRADAADLLARALNFCRRLRPAVVPADADAVDLASQVAARLGAPCALPLPAPRPYRGRRLTARR